MNRSDVQGEAELTRSLWWPAHQRARRPPGGVRGHGGGHPALITPALAWRLVTIFGASTSFYLLLSVVPLYAQGMTHSDGGAGSATGVLMGATVAGEIVAPSLSARFGGRLLLGAGLALLGVPAMLLTTWRSQTWVLAICAVRGWGFAATVVAGGAMTVELIPAERRAEGLAVVGAVSSVPSLVALPLGIWLAGRLGYTPVALAAGVASIAGVIAIPRLPRDEQKAPRTVGIISSFGRPELVLPAATFAVTAAAAGIIVTYLPIVSGATSETVTLALLIQPTTSTLARIVAGRRGDQTMPTKLLIPGLVACAGGIAFLAGDSIPLLVFAGSAIFGAGFGLCQNVTLTVMYQSRSAGDYATVSGLWNLSYDAGMGLGALGFGRLSGIAGYPVAFTVAAVVVLAALPGARRVSGHRCPTLGQRSSNKAESLCPQVLTE